jgi:hypothetical protein
MKLSSIAWLGLLIASAAMHDRTLAADHLFVVTTDFNSSGNCASLQLEPPWMAASNLEPLGVRPVARHFAGLH